MNKVVEAAQPLLKGLQVTNFKAFSTPIEVPIRPITLIFGANSVGKSSLIQSLLLLKQTLEDKSNAALLPRGSEIDLGSFYEFVHCHELERSVSFKITTNMDTSGEPLDVYEPLISLLIKELGIALLDNYAGESPFPILTIALNFIFTYQKDEGEIICSSLELFVGEDSQPLAIFNPRSKKEKQADQTHEELFVTKVNYEHSAIQRVWENEVVKFKESLLKAIDKELYNDKELISLSFDREAGLDSYTIENFAHEFLTYENNPITLDHFLPRNPLPTTPRDMRDVVHDREHFPRFYHLSEFRNVARKHLYNHILKLFPSNPDHFLFEKSDFRTIGNLARKLQSRSDRVSKHIYKRLTDDTRNLLDKYNLSEELQNALANEMNELIQGPLLYEREHFAGIELSLQTKRLLERKRTGVELVILNRLLLEDAYPMETEKCTLWVMYTDLGNILASFLPNNMAIYAGKVLRQALSEIIYIGPLRQSPERFYTFQGAKTHQVGKSGERAFDLLWKNTETLAKVNKFLGKLTEESQRYSLKLLPLKSSGDEVQEAFTIRLYDSALTHANIADVGFGISQVLPVIVQSAFSTGKVLCIEQPELHLHPRAQADLGDLFIDSALTQSNTFIIETHSEHLLLRILRRIRETTENTLGEGQTPITPDDVQVIYAKYSPNGTKLYTLAITPDGDFADKWPDGFFEERAEELF